MNQHKGGSATAENTNTIATKGSTYLLGIGINMYENFPTLFNAVKDIDDVAALLSEQYYFEQSNIQLLKNQDATRENIIEGLSEYSNILTPDDRLLIYFSGHGFMDKNKGLGYWIPTDARKDKVFSYVSNAEVREQLKTFKAKHILLISDSCFSASLLVRDASRDISSAFEDWERNPSRWVFISGKGVVSDGEKGKNSPFAAGVLKHLSQNSNEAINIARLADEVTKEITFNYEQQAEVSPLFDAGHQGGQFVFMKRQTEKDDWTATLRQNTDSAYLIFIEKYPNSAFLAKANENLEAFADEKEWAKAILLDAAFAYKAYEKKYPDGKYIQAAKAKLEAIKNAEHIKNQRLANVEVEEKRKKDAAIQLELEQKYRAEQARKKQEKAAAEQADLEQKYKEEQARKKAEVAAAVAEKEKNALLEQKNKEEQARKAAALIEAEAEKSKVKAAQSFGNQAVDVVPEPAPSKSKQSFYITMTIGIAALCIVVWFLIPSKQPSIIEPNKDSTTVTTTQPKSTTTPSTTTVTNTQSKIEPKQKEEAIKPNKFTEKAVNQEVVPINTTPTKLVFDTQKAKNYLANAKRYCEGELSDKALNELAKVENMERLPNSVKQKITNAKNYINGDLEDKAAQSIQEAIDNL